MNIACVGLTVDELEVFLKIGSKSYKCADLAEAVDASYKICSLFNERFPVSAKPIYMFLAEAVYEVEQKSMHQRVRNFNLKLGRVLKVPAKRAKKTIETIRKKKKHRWKNNFMVF